MCASGLLKNGIPWIKEVLNDLEFYMNDMPFASVQSFKGIMSQQKIEDPSAYGRANYIAILEKKQWASSKP
jgi:hypothetical protein